MAKSGAVWGIDIGNCAIKALRCRRHEKDDNRVVVEAFDYVEYSKILTQPEADREELVREAIATLVSRNDMKGDRVAISVPGQSGLSRFVKLPPVEAKKIPDMVRYEARQQIPFALEDVVWDYQALAGGAQEEGYALETEVGLFAMKRDQVHRALRPLLEAGIEVDYIQLAPLAIYNFACFDRMNNMEGVEPYNPAKPPKSIMVLSLGTETTDLVVTNGYRVWQRNIPIGGSHFTRALTKDLRLTFTKAEHVKRNAAKAEDKKAIFQAMRPVFSDLVSEVQRSMGFFMNNNKNAEIASIVALGNPMKLPGLQRFLSQNLEQEVTLIEEYTGLVGGSVTASPQFQANHLSFGEAYGLCVQGLDLAQLKTNLLPEEIITERLIKVKKPWTVAAAAMLLVGMMASYVSYYAAWASANTQEPNMSQAISSAEREEQRVRSFEGENQALKTRYSEVAQIRKNLRLNDDGRLLWLELLRAVDTALPKDPRPMGEKQQTAQDVRNRTELHITSLDCEHFADVSTWYSQMKSSYEEAQRIVRNEPAPDEGAGATPEAQGEAAPEEAAGAADIDPELLDESIVDAKPFSDTSEQAEDTGPTGPGWIIQITGYHLHNSDPTVPNDPLRSNEGFMFVTNTLIENLKQGKVRLPSSQGELVEVPMKDLGISYPVLVPPIQKPIDVLYDPNATSVEEATKRWRDWQSAQQAASQPTLPGRNVPQQNVPPVEEPVTFRLRRFDFVVQFLWQPKPRGERENPNVDGSDEEQLTAIPLPGEWKLHQITWKQSPLDLPATN